MTALDSRHLAKTINTTIRRVEKRKTRAIWSTQLASSKNEPHEDQKQITSTTCALRNSVHSWELSPRSAASMTQALDMSHQSCALLCTCFHHFSRMIRSPMLRESIFGAFFFTSVGLYATHHVPRHNIRHSRLSRCVSLSYLFSRWLTEHVLSVVFTYAQMQAPELCLRVFRIRSYKEAIFIHASNGETNEIKALVASGQGSPLNSVESGGPRYTYNTPSRDISRC